MPAITRPRLSTTVVATMVLSGALFFGGPALAGGQTTPDRGGQLLAQIERGQTKCSDLDHSGYAAIGEFAMGRMVGSAQTHEAMDGLIVQMMGKTGVDRIHDVMGQRFAGCGAAAMPAGFGQMMGVMGMMGGGAGGFDPSAVMGGYDPGSGTSAGEGGYGPGSMMGFAADRGDDGGGIEPWTVAMMLGLALAVVVGTFLLVPRRRSSSGVLDVLAERFARGEISAEDFQERRQLLLGGGK